MKLSKRLRKWRMNITTQTPLDYVLMLHGDILGFADEVKALEVENKKLRKLAEVLVNCGRKYHTMSGSCPMFDADAEDDDFCGAVQVARDLGIEVR